MENIAPAASLIDLRGFTLADLLTSHDDSVLDAAIRRAVAAAENCDADAGVCAFNSSLP
jgi:hypothetical protein